jgi:DNA repair protein RecO (recombination protein O)
VLLETPAVVLHAFDYRETSRILRLATRDGGVRSVIARGARRARHRFGAALDLFAGGDARIAVHATRDLHALDAFDVTVSRPALALTVPRFTAAAALAELVLRFGHDDAAPGLYDALVHGLDAIAAAPAPAARTAGLAAGWRVVAELGFAPSLDRCARCHAPLPADHAVAFVHRVGGALCERCAAEVGAGRTLPADARAWVARWLAAPAPDDGASLDPRAARAHLRLLREFVGEHLGDARPLRAFAVWEREA